MTLSTYRSGSANLTHIAFEQLVRVRCGRQGLNRLSEQLYLLAERLEGRGVLRTADDLQAVADDLREKDPTSRAEDVRVWFAVERLELISSRLARGGFARIADELDQVVDECRRILEAPPTS